MQGGRGAGSRVQGGRVQRGYMYRHITEWRLVVIVVVGVTDLLLLCDVGCVCVCGVW